MPLAYLWITRDTSAGSPWGAALVLFGIVAPILGHASEYFVLFGDWHLRLPVVPALLLLLASFSPAVIGLELGILDRVPAHRRTALAMLAVGLVLTCTLGFILLLSGK